MPKIIPPDHERIEELSREVDRLVKAGKWNKQEFDRVGALAIKALGGSTEYPGLLEFLALHSDPSWAASDSPEKRAMRNPPKDPQQPDDPLTEATRLLDEIHAALPPDVRLNWVKQCRKHPDLIPVANALAALHSAWIDAHEALELKRN
jgi:hypothetical protein